MPSPWTLILVGLASGALAGTLGAGGGFATVVLLVAAGVDPHRAVGTSLVYVVVIATLGSAVHLRQRTAIVEIGLELGVPAALTAIVGAHIAQGLNDRALTIAFGALNAIVVATLVVRRPVRPGRDPRGSSPDVIPVSGGQVARQATTRRTLFERRLAAVAAGSVVGIAQGLFGVGGGFLFIPVLILFLGVSEEVAAGTSLIAVLIGSVAGSVRHASFGNVDGSLLWYLLPAGIVSGVLGARAGRRIPPAVLRATFTVVMLSSAIYMLARGI